ncbi:MAG TPA: MFS transporter [Jatrophihabitans sp.]|nr:MFS transporter [Jatrophihabitans sp.]
MSFTSSRDLRLVVGAKAVSLLGDEVATVALVLRLQASGAGAGAVAALLIANLAPIVLLTGVVGRLVDRHDNRRLLIASSAAQAAVCVVLAFVSSTPALLALVALLGAGQAVNGATWQAMLPSLVAPADLARAVSRSQAATTLAGVAAPALSGLLVGAYGASVPLLVDAATFLAVTAAAVALRTRRVPEPAADAARERGGLAIVWHHPLLRTTIVLLGLFVLLGSMVNVAEVFLVRATLHASTLWYGLTGTGYALGVLAGALLAGRVRGAGAHARWFVAAAAGLGIGLVGMGLAPDVAALLVICAGAGVANGVLNVCTGSLVMGTARPAERGRVGAVLGGVVSATQLAAYAVGGALAGAASPRAIFVGAGVLGLLAPLLAGAAVIRAAGQRSEPVAAAGQAAAAA